MFICVSGKSSCPLSGLHSFRWKSTSTVLVLQSVWSSGRVFKPSAAARQELPNMILRWRRTSPQEDWKSSFLLYCTTALERLFLALTTTSIRDIVIVTVSVCFLMSVPNSHTSQLLAYQETFSMFQYIVCQMHWAKNTRICYKGMQTRQSLTLTHNPQLSGSCVAVTKLPGEQTNSRLVK